MKITTTTLLKMTSFFIAFTAIINNANATVIPSWFDPSDYDQSTTGTLGRTDVDLPSTHWGPGTGWYDYISDNGIAPGTEWFAWMEIDSAHIGEVSLTWWDSIESNANRENRFNNSTILDTDTSHSPLGGPALNGYLDSNSDFFMCIHHITDPNCAYENTAAPLQNISYTFYLKYAPTSIPEPSSLIMMGLGILGFSRRKLKVNFSENFWKTS